MIYLLISLVMISFGIQNFSFKLFSRYFMKNLASYYLFNALSSALIALIAFIIYPRPQLVPLPVALISAAFGVVYISAVLSYMKAVACGPASYTTLIYSFGLLVPILFGLLVWKEKIGLLQIIGIIFLFITFYLGSGSASADDKKVNFKWIVLCAMALLFNGFAMVLQKEQQIVSPGKYIYEFLMISYLTSTLLSLVLFLYQKLFAKDKTDHLKSGKFAAITVIVGAVTASGTFLNLLLCSRLPSVIMFPVINGGIVLLFSICSYFVLKEKFTVKNIIGMVIGIAALFMLSV